MDARIIGNARQRAQRGGIRGWPEVKLDIVRHLRSDPGAVATTMVDYYALPQTGSKAWPGRAKAAALAFEEKGSTIEAALQADISAEMGNGFDCKRFIPFIVIHEFEGLLFSDCDAFAKGLGRPELAKEFAGIRNKFASPEEINDSPQTAPSKRIRVLIPNYQKPIHGNLAALEMGICKIRRECPNFRNWLDTLESLV